MAGNLSNSGGSMKGYIGVLLAIIVIAAAASGLYVWKQYDIKHNPAARQSQTLTEVKTIASPQEQYDVIVAGTDPEGVAAAVSASRNGLKTLLVDGRDRAILGGLMTLGWLNSLDMNYEPEKGVLNHHELMNKGIFAEWYSKIEGDSFDVVTAANAFHQIAGGEANLDVLLKVQSMEPIVDTAGGASKVTGLKLTLADGSTREVKASAVIDATQDADIAALAGVPYTFGREDLGDKKSRMAVTLVFRLNNITPDVWKKVQERLEGDGDAGTGANAMSAWGYKDMKDYPSVNKERVAMRGLNIGRQNDNTMLINALQVFGIDGTDPKSREEAFEIAKSELPHIVAHMKSKYPEFANIELDGTAPELYVRETRHIQGEYRLSIIDVVENRDHWDRIGFGEYPVDIQRLSPADTGAVVTDPKKYAIPFRTIVPLKVDGLLVIGRASSFDTLPHGSARVIPIGMAAGEAAGAAVKIANERKLTFRQMAASKEAIETLQATLNAQGMVLQPYELKPEPFMSHKAYEGLKVAITLGLTTGGYDNNFRMDEKSNQQRMVNLLEGLRKHKPDAMKGAPSGALAKGADAKTLPVTLDHAAYMIALLLKLEGAGMKQAVSQLQTAGYLTAATVESIANKEELTNADTYMLIKDVVQALNK
ncbi:FAD-dependent oxidoreductase [Paenibacillus sp. YYML68]|uniref:FAD-dependent oxidoreductase n=1 Tax=Paenibacillus sp. YYML68 TaxID=2909250 RepID=UPI0024928674|nr:FAD-dependent oxidoreductase [Paenibacillus sp. YYML68]